MRGFSLALTMTMRGATPGAASCDQAPVAQRMSTRSTCSTAWGSCVTSSAGDRRASWQTSRISARISRLRVGVEVAGRLVGQQQPRLVDERARDRDALALAHRELLGRVVRRDRRGRPARATAAPAVAPRAASSRLPVSLIVALSSAGCAASDGRTGRRSRRRRVGRARSRARTARLGRDRRSAPRRGRVAAVQRRAAAASSCPSRSGRTGRRTPRPVRSARRRRPPRTVSAPVV